MLLRAALLNLVKSRVPESFNGFQEIALMDVGFYIQIQVVGATSVCQEI